MKGRYEDRYYEELKSGIGEGLRRPNPFQRYGFLKNPFPKAGDQTAEPCYNQDDVKAAFKKKFLSFAQSEGQTSGRLLILGDHRVGKTNFLLYSQRQISKLQNEGVIEGVIPLYVSGPYDNFLKDVHRPVIVELSNKIFPTFFEIVKNYDKPLQNGGDLTRAIEAVVQPPQPELQQFDRTEERIRLFTKWFSGAKCTQGELRALGGVFSSIDTSSLAIKYFRDFVVLARRLDVFKGIIILLDEFELIFGGAVTASKRARYLQDLRHFIDTMQAGILLVVASLSAILVGFQRDYPALKNRFGDSQELSPIQDEKQAVGYARAYLDFERAVFLEKDGEDKDYDDIISEDIIASVFEEVQKEYHSAQGMFFDKLYNKVEEKVRGQRGAR